MISKYRWSGIALFYLGGASVTHFVRATALMLALVTLAACGLGYEDRDPGETLESWHAIMGDRVGAVFEDRALSETPRPDPGCGRGQTGHLRVVNVLATRGIARFLDIQFSEGRLAGWTDDPTDLNRHAGRGGNTLIVTGEISLESRRTDAELARVSLAIDDRNSGMSSATLGHEEAVLLVDLLQPLVGGAATGPASFWSDESIWLLQGCWRGQSVARVHDPDSPMVRALASQLALLLDTPELNWRPLPFRAHEIGAVRSGYLGAPRRRLITW